MKIDSLFEAGFKEFGARFFLVAFLPIMTIAILIVGLDASGAPQEAPSWSKLVSALNEFDITKWVGLVLIVLVLSLISMPLQEALVRVFEGYWGVVAETSWLGQPCLNLQRKRRASLASMLQDVPENPTHSQLSKIESAARRLSKYYPSEDRLLPTSLGNALRAAEDLATSRYGLDAVVIWPRLYPSIGSRLGQLVDSARNQLDVSVRLIPAFIICFLVSGGFLFQHRFWIFMPIGFLLMAFFSYRASVEAAAAFGVAMNSAIDLHRFDMLKALHLPMPNDLSSEKSANQDISNFLRQGLAHDLVYVHPKVEKEAKPSNDVPSPPAA